MNKRELEDEVIRLRRERDELRSVLKDIVHYFDQVIIETGYQSEGEEVTHRKAHKILGTKWGCEDD